MMAATLVRWALPGGATEVLVAGSGAPARIREVADVIVGRGEDPAALLRAHPGCLAAARPVPDGPPALRVGLGCPAATGAVLSIEDRHGRAFTAYGTPPPEVCASFAHLACSGSVVVGEAPQPVTYIVGLRRVELFEERERVLQLMACGARVGEGFPRVGAHQMDAGLFEDGAFVSGHVLCLVEWGKGKVRVAGEDVGLGKAEQ